MRRPRIKAVHVPERLAGRRIRLGTMQYGVAAELVDDAHWTAWQLLKLMDGSRERHMIVRELETAAPDLDRQQIEQAMEKLVDAGFVEDAAAPSPESLSPEEVRRYASNVQYFTWVDLEPRASPYVHQERLKQACVAVVGVGGTGSAVAASMAALGVGRLLIVDDDSVESENLTRQLLYTQDDVGQPKARVAAERLRQLNPFVDVIGEERRIDSVAAFEPLFERCDLLVLCADEPRGEIQQWANVAALRTGTPWILSAYTGPMLAVGTFVPGKTPCYRCFEHHADASAEAGELLFEQGDLNAVVAPTANLVGHFAALEATYFLTQLKPQTVGRIFHQNLLIYEHRYFLEAPFWPDCPECGLSSGG